MKQQELIVDSFAGGGGASLGIHLALGRGPDVAINHDAAAIAMHAANHPDTLHFTEDVWKVSPHKVTKGRAVGLLWASPDCKHFSRAKGGKPVEKKIRSLAWVVVKWAAEVHPRVIILENVREFEDWGPLIPKTVNGVVQILEDGSPVLVPDPSRKGHSFRRWAGRLRNLGYEVQWRVLNAADFGAPTHRRRLFLIARNDGRPIVWPEPTHGDPKKLDDTPLFDRLQPWRAAAECIDWSLPCPSIFDRKRPLAENTLRRIALGIKRYVLDNPKPFIVQVNHGGPEFRGQGLGEPMPTMTGKHGFGVVVPHVTKFRKNSIGSGAGEPLPTITSGEGAKRPAGAAHALGLVQAFLARCAHGEDGRRGRGSHELAEPVPTVLGSKDFALVAANLVRFNHDDAGVPIDAPLPTTTTNNHAALVYSFLVKYYRTAIGQNLNDPLHSVTVDDRFGLVYVHVNGEPYVIVDIGMRMLTPRELARAQGFPDGYLLIGSKSAQVARIGNSVCPVMARVLCEVNYTPAKAGKVTA